jgi:hypothetical protein
MYSMVLEEDFSRSAEIIQNFPLFIRDLARRKESVEN